MDAGLAALPPMAPPEFGIAKPVFRSRLHSSVKPTKRKSFCFPIICVSPPSRVQLAILKLAAGDINALQTHLEMAKRDYRDVLAFAEYPGYFTKVPPTATSSDSAHAEVIEDDWKQYQEWLKKRES